MKKVEHPYYPTQSERERTQSLKISMQQSQYQQLQNLKSALEYISFEHISEYGSNISISSLLVETLLNKVNSDGVIARVDNTIITGNDLKETQSEVSKHLKLLKTFIPKLIEDEECFKGVIKRFAVMVMLIFEFDDDDCYKMINVTKDSLFELDKSDIRVLKLNFKNIIATECLRLRGVKLENAKAGESLPTLENKEAKEVFNVMRCFTNDLDEIFENFGRSVSRSDQTPHSFEDFFNIALNLVDKFYYIEYKFKNIDDESVLSNENILRVQEKENNN